MVKLQGEHCPFCNGKKLVSFSASAHDSPPKTVSIIECQTCQAGWQWPLKQTETQSAIDFENNYVQHSQGSYFDPVKRDSVARFQCTFLEGMAQQPGRLLDVGCGDGNFCRAMAQRGWDVLGLDPALPAESTEVYASGQIRLTRSGLSDLADSELFDIITLWDVVEHVELPQQLIALAASRLAPGGRLVVETGNYQSAARVMNQHSWWNFQIDHRWYLAPPQLSAMLSQAGLGRIELIDHVLRPWWKGKSDVSPQTLLTLAKTAIKKPWRMPESLRIHRELNACHAAWKDWGGLEIMTMVGRK